MHLGQGHGFAPSFATTDEGGNAGNAGVVGGGGGGANSGVKSIAGVAIVVDVLPGIVDPAIFGS